MYIYIRFHVRSATGSSERGQSIPSINYQTDRQTQIYYIFSKLKSKQQ